MTRLLAGLRANWQLLAAAALVAYPFLPVADVALGTSLTGLFVYAILALGLNVVVGYTGLLHLGIAAFFGIGAYTLGILSVRLFPFQQSFVVSAAAAFAAAAALGVVATAPTLRLRGDYLALVTLGFGLIVYSAIKNLEQITEGTRGLNPVSPNLFPFVSDADWSEHLPRMEGWAPTPGWRVFPYFYFLCLGSLVLASVFLRNLERSRLGRAWVALREDELAASCMGLNPAKLKLAAMALGAGIAGLAGALFAVGQRNVPGPSAFDFNRSIFALCCVIFGGIGNRPGVLLGTFLLLGYDMIVTPKIDDWIQGQGWGAGGKQFYKVKGWQYFIFGMALILIMRFRPEGLLPAERMKRELHPEADAAAGTAAARAEVGK
jgi:branched-chain amino acid transport system permease protein